MNKILEQNKELIPRLIELGILSDGSTVRDSNVGKSDYSKHIIQPWSIWKDYSLNPWDADIVKRILRTKREFGMSEQESRKMDYEKIIHICQERIRQLDLESNVSATLDPLSIIDDFQKFYNVNPESVNDISCSNTSEMSFHLNKEQIEAYQKFSEEHSKCRGNSTIGGGIEFIFEPTGVGCGITVRCPFCEEELNLTDYTSW